MAWTPKGVHFEIHLPNHGGWVLKPVLGGGIFANSVFQNGHAGMVEW
jgi:hypothetical protein